SERIAKALKYIHLPATEPALLDTVLIFLNRVCGKLKFTRDPNPVEHIVIINEYPLISKHSVIEEDKLECNDKTLWLYLVYDKLVVMDFYSRKIVSVIYHIESFEVRDKKS
ncbi:MAG: hypothetical protein JHC26_11525, partial [Thermofilum sp.]|uniref:hypothetical protein n=1 Tax=Thermofilum sp. TaxID=1961369 RepID=UPI002582FD74